MKSLFLFISLTVAVTTNAQTNSGTSTTPNSGASTTPPPMQTYTTPADNMANPSNSTVPGANGSYSTDPGKPQFQNPGTNGSYTAYPNNTQPATTYSQQTGTTPQKKKVKK